LADLVDQTRQQIAERQKALEPALEEYQRLEQALTALDAVIQSFSGAGRLGHTTSRAISRPGKARTNKGRRPKAKAPARSKRAGVDRPPSPRAKQALAIVAERPEVTIAELASRMGVKANYLYRVLPDLERAGKVTRRGKGFVARGWDKGGP
jgi:hypothetical protein